MIPQTNRGGKMEINLKERVELLERMKADIDTLIDFHNKFKRNSVVRKMIEYDIDESWQRIKGKPQK